LEIPAFIRIRHYSTLRRIATDFTEPIAVVKVVHVYWGQTGSGKSRRAWAEAGMDAYPKDPITKWWCGYRDHRNVVIDEFRGDVSLSKVLRWFDRYPVLVEVKGGAVVLKAQEFWLTSNTDPKSWYPQHDQESRNALLRRFTNIVHFDNTFIE